MQKIRLLVIGLPYFARKLMESLRGFDTAVICAFSEPGAGAWGKAIHSLKVAACDVLFVISGTVSRSGSIALALSLGKKVVIEWVGSDVLKAREDIRCGRADRRLMKECFHLCECEPIREELLELGVAARILPFGSFDSFGPAVRSFPDRFSVMTYIPPGHERQYGFDWIVRLAGDFPGIPIRITSLGSWAEPLPSNIELLGRVPESDKARYVDACAAYVRLVEHDGLSFSILEAMSRGRYVGYTQKMDGTTLIRSYDDLRAFVGELSMRHAAGSLGINEQAVHIAAETYGKERVLGDMVAFLLDTNERRTE